MTTAVVAACGALGVMVGAALDVVVVRVPRRQPVVEPGALGAIRSPHCVVLAIVCAVLFGFTAARFAGSWALPAYLVLVAALLALAVIDIEHFLLPNRIVYPTAVAMLALLGLAALGESEGGALLRAIVAATLSFAVMLVLHLISPTSLGFGDVRLASVLGLALGWLGWGELALGFFLGFLYGAVVGAVLVLARLRRRRDHVPFGPFLAAGTTTAVLWGTAILDWYDGR